MKSERVKMRIEIKGDIKPGESPYQERSALLAKLENRVDKTLCEEGFTQTATLNSREAVTLFYTRNKEVVHVRSVLDKEPLRAFLEIEGPEDIISSLKKTLDY